MQLWGLKERGWSCGDNLPPPAALHSTPYSLVRGPWQELWDKVNEASPGMRRNEVKVAQLYPILCNPMDCGPSGFPVHGSHQARIMKKKKKYWSGLPFPSPGDHPNPGIKLRSPALQTDSLPSEPPEEPLNAGG